MGGGSRDVFLFRNLVRIGGAVLIGCDVMVRVGGDAVVLSSGDVCDSDW